MPRRAGGCFRKERSPLLREVFPGSSDVRIWQGHRRVVRAGRCRRRDLGSSSGQGISIWSNGAFPRTVLSSSGSFAYIAEDATYFPDNLAREWAALTTRGNPIFTASDIRASRLVKSDENSVSGMGIANFFACRNRFSLSERASYRSWSENGIRTFSGKRFTVEQDLVNGDICHRKQDRVDISFGCLQHRAKKSRGIRIR